MLFVYDLPNPRFAKCGFDHAFWSLADRADRIDIAVGYVDVGSIAMLLDAMRGEFTFELNFLIGMQYHDGFTGPQIAALENLCSFLRETDRGQVLVSKKVRYHGKVYVFWEEGLASHAYVGSGNLSAIGNSERPNLEAGLLVDRDVNQFDDYVNNQVFPLGTPLELGELVPALAAPSPLEFMPTANDLGGGMPEELERFEPTLTFDLPLKCEKKSNMNVSYGKPRVHTASGRAIPRPWYEVEIIPGTKIARLEGFPKRNEIITVVTDDNFEFRCECNGGNSENFGKNFRSVGNLATLGGFIKGRLESYGIVAAGDFVKPSHLAEYGRNTVSLNYYEETGRWILDFRPEEIS